MFTTLYLTHPNNNKKPFTIFLTFLFTHPKIYSNFIDKNSLIFSLLLDRKINGETKTNFNLKIADFGLAKSLVGSPHMTAYMGTFVSIIRLPHPEQKILISSTGWPQKSSTTALTR